METNENIFRTRNTCITCLEPFIQKQYGRKRVWCDECWNIRKNLARKVKFSVLCNHDHKFHQYYKFKCPICLTYKCKVCFGKLKKVVPIRSRKSIINLRLICDSCGDSP